MVARLSGETLGKLKPRVEQGLTGVTAGNEPVTANLLAPRELPLYVPRFNLVLTPAVNKPAHSLRSRQSALTQCQAMYCLTSPLLRPANTFAWASSPAVSKRLVNYQKCKPIGNMIKYVVVVGSVAQLVRASAS